MKVIPEPILALCAVISLTLVLWQHFHPSDDFDAVSDPTVAAEVRDDESSLPGILDQGVRLFLGQADFFGQATLQD